MTLFVAVGRPYFLLLQWPESWTVVTWPRFMSLDHTPSGSPTKAKQWSGIVLLLVPQVAKLFSCPYHPGEGITKISTMQRCRATKRYNSWGRDPLFVFDAT